MALMAWSMRATCSLGTFWTAICLHFFECFFGTKRRVFGLPDFCYLAPECYDNHCFQESDVFSFGVILYEILTGQPAFPKETDQRQIAFKVYIKKARPKIPKFVLPSTQELITDCWAQEPGDRPSFEEIVDRLKKMKFKVISGVNPAKLSKFVKNIEEFEAQNKKSQH
jgi:serine/threonine protein kinase